MQHESVRQTIAIDEVGEDTKRLTKVNLARLMLIEGELIITRDSQRTLSAHRE